MKITKPIVLGILNCTPDSFSDGGRFLSLPSALRQAGELRSAGADLIDLGGESTRPGARPVEPRVELARVLPVLRALKQRGFRVSLDSRQPLVVETCWPLIDWYNSVSGLADPALQKIAAKSRKPVIVMHSTDLPVDPTRTPRYRGGVTSALLNFFRTRLAELALAGVAADRVILDPGIGFGKSLKDNLRLLRDLPVFAELGCPICLGASRKSFIAKLDGSSVAERLGGSLAAVVLAESAGVQVFRVHDVAETVQALAVARAIRRAD